MTTTTELGFTVETWQAQRGTYTARQFQERWPDKYAVICQALALGMSLEAIRKAAGVAWETVRAIRDSQQPVSLRELKGRLAGLLGGILTQRLEQIADDPQAVAKLGMLDIGIALDKLLLLHGEASSIVETRMAPPTVAAFEAFCRTVSQREEMTAKGRVVDSEPRAAVALASGEKPLDGEPIYSGDEGKDCAPGDGPNDLMTGGGGGCASDAHVLTSPYSNIQNFLQWDFHLSTSNLPPAGD